ncbi:MAG: DUF167 domain-containing protein [Candidatus Latescibacteria bacterium]|nr:DUF167 domain-containing protein [Candidatus Latescibacterota bacterium]
MTKKISVFIKPNSRLEKIEQSADTYIVSVQEPPIENRANLALIRLIAEYFHVPKSNIRITSGFKSRRKVIEIKT